MRILLLILALIAPLPALALSCIAPTVERSFDQFAAAEDDYVIVDGTLAFDPTRMPKGMTEVNPPEMTRVPATMSGMSMDVLGSFEPFNEKITLEVLCIGPWCGGISQDTWTMAFLRRTENSYALVISPCGGTYFIEPTDEQVETAQRCMRNGTCESTSTVPEPNADR